MHETGKSGGAPRCAWFRLPEAAALASNLVLDAHCEGIPDPEWGSRVVLHAVPANNVPDLDESTLLAALRQKLPAYALPKSVLFYERLPRSAIGKWQGKR